MSRGGAGIAVGWRSRAEPLVPSGAIALGDTARALAARLLRCDDEALARLRGVAARGEHEAIVILGEAADLPWLDGIVYLGRDLRAPSLFVPTFLEPDVPIELVERALLRRGTSSTSIAPLAILPEASLLVPCGRALTLARDPLVSFAAGRS